MNKIENTTNFIGTNETGFMCAGKVVDVIERNNRAISVVVSCDETDRVTGEPKQRLRDFQFWNNKIPRKNWALRMGYRPGDRILVSGTPYRGHSMLYNGDMIPSYLADFSLKHRGYINAKRGAGITGLMGDVISLSLKKTSDNHDRAYLTVSATPDLMCCLTITDDKSHIGLVDSITKPLLSGPDALKPGKDGRYRPGARIPVVFAAIDDNPIVPPNNDNIIFHNSKNVHLVEYRDRKTKAPVTVSETSVSQRVPSTTM